MRTRFWDGKVDELYKVGSIRPGTSEVTFVFTNLSRSEEFVPVIRAERAFEGTIEVIEYRIQRAGDVFVAAFPRRESTRNAGE